MTRKVVLSLMLAAALNAVAVPAGGWRDVVSRAWVSDVAVAGDAIWLGYPGGGAARYEPATGDVKFYTAADGLIHNYVTAVALAGGRAFFATRNGMSIRDTDGRWRNFVRMWGFAHNDATGVAADGRYVYLATAEGARRFDLNAGAPTFTTVPKSEGPASLLSPQIEDGWKVYFNPDGVVLDDLYSVTVAEDGVYWGGRGRVFASAYGAEDWREIRTDLPPMAEVRRILPSRDGLIVATGEGAFALKGEETNRFGGPLGRAEVRDALAFAGLEFYAADEGLFVRRPDGAPFHFPAGTAAAFTKLKDARKGKSPWWRLGVGDGLPSPRCTSLAAYEESVVVGTENGACILNAATGVVTQVPIPHNLPGGGVYTLAWAGGRLWAGTPEGLAAIDVGDASVQKIELPGEWREIRDLKADGAGLLVTTRAGVAKADYNGNVENRLDLRAAGAGGEPRCAAAAGGRYWLGTDEGLVELDSSFGVARTWGEGAGFPNVPVRALLPLGSELLCGTQGGGLVVVDVAKGTLRVLREGAGVSGDTVFSLAADGEHVYVGTFDKGVDVLGRDLSFQRNLSWGDGLSHTDIWACAPVGPWLWLAIRGVGLNVADLTPESKEAVRRYYARYGLGDEYVKAVAVLPAEGNKTRLAFGTAAGVVLLEFEGPPPDLTAEDFDAAYP